MLCLVGLPDFSSQPKESISIQFKGKEEKNGAVIESGRLRLSQHRLCIYQLQNLKEYRLPKSEDDCDTVARYTSLCADKNEEPFPF